MNEHERELRLRRGALVRIAEDDGHECFEICGEGGRWTLAIHVTDDGPLLSLQGAQLSVDAADIALRCDRFALRARTLDIDVEEDMRWRSRNARLEAAGELQLRANDDARISGERVLLNSDDVPPPISLEAYRAKIREERLDREDAIGADGVEAQLPPGL